MQFLKNKKFQHSDVFQVQISTPPQICLCIKTKDTLEKVKVYKSYTGQYSK